MRHNFAQLSFSPHHLELNLNIDSTTVSTLGSSPVLNSTFHATKSAHRTIEHKRKDCSTSLKTYFLCRCNFARWVQLEPPNCFPTMVTRVSCLYAAFYQIEYTSSSSTCSSRNNLTDFHNYCCCCCSHFSAANPWANRTKVKYYSVGILKRWMHGAHAWCATVAAMWSEEAGPKERLLKKETMLMVADDTDFVEWMAMGNFVKKLECTLLWYDLLSLNERSWSSLVASSLLWQNPWVMSMTVPSKRYRKQNCCRILNPVQ